MPGNRHGPIDGVCRAPMRIIQHEQCDHRRYGKCGWNSHAPALVALIVLAMGTAGRSIMLCGGIVAVKCGDRTGDGCRFDTDRRMHGQGKLRPQHRRDHEDRQTQALLLAT